jgi:hypothetical protein
MSQSEKHALRMDQIVPWLVSPFKVPLKHKAKNTYFTRKVSTVHVHTEHTIGKL